jgi:hypothetical protein
LIPSGQNRGGDFRKKQVMKTFRQIFRASVVVLLLGGWGLAAAAVHVIRVPGQSFPVVITKEHLGYKDTYIDTRKWTVSDDAAHPAVVSRLLELRQSDLLAHTVNTSRLSTESQLRSALGGSVASADTKTVLGVSNPKVN